MPTEILDLQQLRVQPLTTDPFPFVVASDMLRREQIRALARDFPDMSDGGLYPADVLPLGPSMQRLVEEICSDEFRGAVEQKFGIDLRGCPPMVTLRGYSRDKDGRIHADSEDKVVSLVLYLNEEWPHRGGNLRLLRSPDDLDSTLVEIPSVAGAMVIFKVTRNGWHGHHKFVGQRRVLMVNYMVSEAARRRELKRHRFSARVKRLKKWVGM